MDATPETPEPRSVTVRYDESTIQREASAMPEHLRADYVWLKTFVREQCSRSINDLMVILRKHGISHDQTTISKIVRGFMFRKSDGRERLSPVISAENFATMVRCLRDQVRSESLRGRIPFVETRTFQTIFDFVANRRAPETVNRFGVIVGPTGSGKTAAFKEIVRQVNHGTTRWFESPERANSGELVNRLAISFGFSARTGLTQKKEVLFDTVKPHHCLLIDNAQRLYLDKSTTQAALDYLLRLSDETGCCIILSITPTFERVLIQGLIAGYMEQFEGRSGGRSDWLRLPEYPPADDCVAIATKLGMTDAAEHAKQLAAIAREPGRIRILFHRLQQAKTLAGGPFTYANLIDGVDQ